MPVSDEYVAHIRDLLSAFEPLRIKRMFGGAGIYSGDLSFAILVDDALYLKADDSTRGDYESRGLHPFTYRMRNGRTASMSYYPVPPEAIDDPESLSAWAAKALDAARRAATSDDLISAPRSFVSTQGKDMTDQWEGWRGGDFADSAMALGPDFARIPPAAPRRVAPREHPPSQGSESMSQIQLPLFPPGVTPITSVLAFSQEDGQVTYFNGSMPVFVHAQDDLASFRMITAQFCINGNATQAEIRRAFGVSKISLKRAVKRYREEGPKGFYQPQKRRGPAVLTPEVLASAQQLLDEGLEPSQVADRLGIKRDTFSKAVRAGRLHQGVKKTLAAR